MHTALRRLPHWQILLLLHHAEAQLATAGHVRRQPHNTRQPVLTYSRRSGADEARCNELGQSVRTPDARERETADAKLLRQKAATFRASRLLSRIVDIN